MIRIAFGAAPSATCPQARVDAGGPLTSANLVAAVGSAAEGCSQASRCTVSFVPQTVERGATAAAFWSAQDADDCFLICTPGAGAARVPPEGNISLTARDPMRCTLRCTSTDAANAIECSAALALTRDCAPPSSCLARIERSPEDEYELFVDTDAASCTYSCPGFGAGPMDCQGTISLGSAPHECRVWAASACGAVRRCSTSAWSAPVTVDGMLEDWAPGTQFPTAAGYNYASWDDERLYFAVQHPALGGSGEGIVVTIYLGDGVEGTQRSAPAGTQYCTLPVPMSYAIRWRAASQSVEFLMASASGGWVPVPNAQGAGAPPVVASAEGTAVELGVERSFLGVGDRLYVHMDIADERPGLQRTFAVTPPGSHPDGYMGPGSICAAAQEFDLSDWAQPNTHPTVTIKGLGGVINPAPAATGHSLRIATFNGQYLQLPIGEADMEAYIAQVCTVVSAMGPLLSVGLVSTAIALGMPQAALGVPPPDPFLWGGFCEAALHIAGDYMNGNFQREAGGNMTHAERAEEVAKRILGLDFDVIAMNEVFDEDAREKLASALKGKYPYIVGRLEPPADPQIAEIFEPHLGAYYVQDSGLILFSRYPFEELAKQGLLAPDSGQLDLWWQGSKVSNAAKKAVAFVPFSSHACNDGDCNAGKGAALVRIVKSPDYKFAVAFSHTQASYGSDDDATWNAAMDIRAAQLGDIRSLIEGSLTNGQMNDEPLFVMGDLNIIGRFPDGESFGPPDWPDWDPAHASLAGSDLLNQAENRDWDLGRQEWMHHFCGLRTGQPGDACHNADPSESHLQDPPVPGFFACGNGTKQDCANAPGTPLLVDSWAYDTSPHDVGRTQGRGAWEPSLTTCTRPAQACFENNDPGCDWQPYDRLKTRLCAGERLDYIFHNHAEEFLTGREICAQHLALGLRLSGAAGSQPLSDHMPLTGDFNLWWHHCRPREAKVIDKNLLEQYQDTFTTAGQSQQYQIKYPGSMQWFRIDEPGSYSIGISDGYGFMVYTDEDLSRPRPSYHRMESEWGIRYFLPKPPYYVRVYATKDAAKTPDREKTGSYVLTIHRHKCTSAEDACVIPAGSAARALWPDKHFTSWDPLDPHYSEGPDALWFIITTYTDDKKLSPWLTFENEAAFVELTDHYKLELVEYCQPTGPCTGSHTIVVGTDGFASGPSLEDCGACEFALKQQVASVTDVWAPNFKDNTKGAAYFLRILRDEPLGIYGGPCLSDPCGALENERKVSARYRTELTFFYPNNLQLIMSEDDFGWDDTDELWYSFQPDEEQPRKNKDSSYQWLGYAVEEGQPLGAGHAGVRSYVDNLQPNIYSAAEPNASVDDTDPEWFVPQYGDYFCYPHIPVSPHGGICPLPDDVVGSSAELGHSGQVTYSDDWNANPDDADYIAWLRFCLVHEYAEPEEGQSLVEACMKAGEE